MQVDQGVFLTGEFATDAGEHGAVRLIGAHIGGELSCDGASLSNDSGPTLQAESLQVDQNIFFRGFTATGAGEIGAVRLPGVHAGDSSGCQVV